MSETLDILAVAGIMAVALGYLVYRKIKNRGKGPCCGCSSCGDDAGCSSQSCCTTDLKDLR